MPNHGSRVTCPACGVSVGALSGRLGFGSSRYLRCTGCHSEFLSPQPDDARLAAIYSPDYYEPWKWEDADVVRTMKAHTFRRALRLLNPEAGTHLLDVGCAQGELAEVALSMGLTVTGVDLNAGAIETAKARVRDANFVCGELEPSVVGTGWDVVTMFDFIEHVRSPTGTLSAAAQVLAADGVLLISTPRAGSAVHQLTRRFWPQYREEHLVLFSLLGLQAALRDAGMRIVKAVPTTKYVSFAYLLGQAAAYGPAPTRTAARRARVILKAGAAHRLLPMRFGEMTVLAAKRRI